MPSDETRPHHIVVKEKKPTSLEYLLSVTEYDRVPTTEAYYLPEGSEQELEVIFRNRKANPDISLQHATTLGFLYIKEFFLKERTKKDGQGKDRDRIEMFARILQKHLEDPEHSGGTVGVAYEASVLISQVRMLLERIIQEQIRDTFEDWSHADQLSSVKHFRSKIEEQFLLKLRYLSEPPIYVEEREAKHFHLELQSYDITTMRMLSLYRGFLYVESILDAVRTGLVADKTVSHDIAMAMSTRNQITQEMERFQHIDPVRNRATQYFSVHK